MPQTRKRKNSKNSDKVDSQDSQEVTKEAAVNRNVKQVSNPSTSTDKEVNKRQKRHNTESNSASRNVSGEVLEYC